jgi:Ca2+-binding RTX toxin-like protein
MRLLLGCLAAALFTLLAAGTASAAREDTVPSCAAGPTTIGATTYGTPCADLIVAAPGVEAVQGGGGDDTILAAPVASASCPSGCELGVGSQTFEGGPGDDVVYGQRGNDTLLGGEGNDQLFGGIGDDVLRGGPGNDRLAGGFGADAIDGEAGDDFVHGDGTIDRINDTGGGTDTLSYATGITPGFGAGIDSGQPGFPSGAEGRGLYLDLNAGGQNANNGVAPFGGGVDEVTTAGFEIVVGTAFSDFIVGSAGPQAIYGGGGADVIRGEGGGDTLDGGADGDYVDGGSVVERDPTKVSVGLMAPGAGAWSQLYLTGSSGNDTVSATYAGSSVSFALGSGSFDQSASAAAGCTVAPTQATCPLATPLDSIVFAGLGGADTIDASSFPRSTTVVMLGGEGGDSLGGGPESEDVLVDGPDNEGAFADILSALGGDDALLHNGGPDQLFGGDGNDLFLSDSVCDGNALIGGADRDNASWARFDEGVEANLGSGRAGRPGSGDTPSCGGAGLDSLGEIEDLEGGNSRDLFYGDGGANQLLGHLGGDDYFAGAGADTILANSGDDDPVIDCGEDIDRALVDRHPQYNDATPVNCEVVREADPNSFQILPGFPLPTPPPTAPVITPKPPPRDRLPPRTKILAHPRALLRTAKARRRVAFRFASSERGSRFRCKLDGKPYVACASPRIYSLAPGRHAVRIVAVDRAGNADPTPALFKLRVRRR